MHNILSDLGLRVPTLHQSDIILTEHWRLVSFSFTWMNVDLLVGFNHEEQVMQALVGLRSFLKGLKFVWQRSEGWHSCQQGFKKVYKAEGIGRVSKMKPAGL